MKKYTVLFAEISKKNPDDEPAVYRFESIKEFLSFVKKVKFQEKMNFNYHYILSDSMEKTNKFQYKITEEAKHYKQFKKLLIEYMS